MGPLLNDKSIATRVAGRSLARLIRFVGRTATVLDEPPDLMARLAASHPCILACWHGQFMMLPMLRPPGIAVAAMVARHGDAEFIGQAMSALDVTLIRGAGAGSRKRDRGGAQALRAAVAALEGGQSLVMTADVPPGPARRAGLGIITIARYSGRPIVPAAVATSRFRSFDTWSRMTINLPYSRLARVAGAPIFVPPDADAETMDRLRLELEAALDDVTRRAYALAGADVGRIAPPRPPAPGDAPAPPGWKLVAYARGMSLARPAAALILGHRERQGKEDPARRPERLGRPSMPRPTGRIVWFHAASVGEVNAVLPVIDALLARRADLNVLLTSGTVTSAGLAARRLPPRALHQYVPIDVPGFARSFLCHWQPDLAVFTESEVWPNLILEADHAGIPLALVNARMSTKSFRRWKRLKDVSRPLFSRFRLVLAQNERLARRFAELGAPTVRSVGNLKIDAPPPPIDAAAREGLLAAIGNRPLIVAASTHEGEETVLAEAHRILAREFEGLLTLIAPRHPERGTGLAEALKASGFNVVQRSAGTLPDARTDIYIADTIGELGTFYAMSPAAFVGGSLVDRGGQNPIEAVRHGAAVLTGPSRHNFSDEYGALLKRGGAVEVRSAADIAAAIRRLAHDTAELDRMRAGARAALAALSGALDATVTALEGLLPQPADEGMRRAS
jgi:3-deoxy-D-manno-octulosonic-acid transferase